MENRLKKLANQGKVNPNYGTLYLLAQEKLNEAKDSTSYRSHINALGTQFLSQEILFFK